jgi:4-amino-4-deoxy-L-arabinose transferase-like glycosyltransferase
LFITLIISAGICVLAIILFSDEEVNGLSILVGMGFGVVIWAVAEFVTDFVEKIWPHKILPMYIAMSLVIIIGTYFATMLLEVELLWNRVIICLVSEIVGLIIMISSRHIYKIRLNKKLEEFKERGKNEVQF